jgi:hypothetical protein
MLRRCAFPLLPTLAIAAIAVAGCGGSSNKTTTTTTTSAAAGSTSGAGSTTASGSAGGTTTGSSGASSLSTSTPLNSALAQQLFKQEGVTHGLSESEATKFVACLEQKFASQGVKTFGDASANPTQTRNDSAQCALQVKNGG